MKLPQLGNVNAAAVATLYKRGKAIGTCMDTPNTLAYAFAKTGATYAKSCLGECYVKDKDMRSRVKNAGWLTSDNSAALVLF